MKKLFTILFFVVIATSGFSQQLCQASFTYNYNPAGGTLNLYDNSYNFDSTQINITSWTWTLQYGGASYTYNTQNPIIIVNGFNGPILICLTIYTSAFIPCQSSWCDTIYLNNTPPSDSCIAAFTYQADSLNHQFQFFDLSSTNNGSVNSWWWVITEVNTGNTLYNSNNYQNPTVQLPVNGVYNVCLTISSDSGCVANTCHTIYTLDSINTTCQLNVSENINHVSVIGGNDGYIDLTITGGTPPYSYTWSNGATTEDIYNLTAGVYTVAIGASPLCPSYTYTLTVLQPYDSNNIYVDTLYTSVVDTCLNFLVDTSYIGSISVQGNTVIVEWIFVGGGLTQSLFLTYTYTNNGPQMVVLSLNCNGSKNITTYTSYIYISQAVNVSENSLTNQFYLYPNPVTDFLNITFSSQILEPLSLNIFSGIGKLVYNSTVAIKTSQLGISVNHLLPGVYFVCIDSGNGKPFVKKFIK